MKNLRVAAGIIWKQDRFLLSQKSRGAFRGFWEFPGGKIEGTESPEEALIRELQEELSIRPTHLSFWRSVEHTYAEEGLHVHLDVFHVLAFEGNECPNEGQTIRWVTTTEARGLPFLAADAPLLHDIRCPQPVS